MKIGLNVPEQTLNKNLQKNAHFTFEMSRFSRQCNNYVYMYI